MEDFPDYFPDRSVCPPRSAHPWNDIYYRLASENPFDLDDEKNHVCHKLIPKGFSKKKECQACAISGFIRETDLDEFRQRMSQFSEDWLTYPVIKYSISDSDGLILRTGGITPDHHDFWPYLGISMIQRRVI